MSSILSRHLIFIALATCLLPMGCHRVPDTIEPSVNYTVQDKYLQSLPSAFPPLSQEELDTPFGREMLIGQQFAKQLDLYQAITAFKRALFLLPAEWSQRKEEIYYEILLCYYMAHKWQEVLSTFENSSLRHVSSEFPPFTDLLLILEETYTKLNMPRQTEGILDIIQTHNPQEASALRVSTALSQAQFPTLKAASAYYPYLTSFLNSYAVQKKSVGRAQGLNALIPGAGYLYLGQTQSAITAFILNGLFIAASVYFFETGNTAAGAIFTSFEAGWYFGGIYGAGLEAKSYNERLYESLATSLMHKERLFPGLRIRYAF